MSSATNSALAEASIPTLLMCLAQITRDEKWCGSIIFQAECEMRYITDCLVTMIEKEIASVEVCADIHDEYNERVDNEYVVTQ